MAKTQANKRPLLNPEAAAQSHKQAPSKSNRGVVYLKNLPVGFFEPQLKEFLKQFGAITRIRVAKSSKTGHSKGFGWVEFEHHEVARIVAETMNNYLVAGKSIVASLMDKDEVHEDTFRNWSRKFKHIPWHQIAIDQSRKNEVVSKEKVKKESSKASSLQKKIDALGLDYTAPTIKDVINRGAQ